MKPEDKIGLLSIETLGEVDPDVQGAHHKERNKAVCDATAHTLCIELALRGFDVKIQRPMAERIAKRKAEIQRMATKQYGKTSTRK